MISHVRIGIQGQLAPKVSVQNVRAISNFALSHHVHQPSQTLSFVYWICDEAFRCRTKLDCVNGDGIWYAITSAMVAVIEYNIP